MRVWKGVLFVVCGLAFATPANAGAVATYQFNNNLNADQGGVASLVSVDPTSSNGFVADTVYGHARTVFAFNGSNSPPSSQGGLTLDTTGLVSNTTYSVEMVFELTQRDNAWRRILDVQNRQSDNGFYVDPSNQLDIYPVAGGASFTNNAYHDVVLTVSAGVATAYLDGVQAFSTSTNVMDINNTGNLMGFFLDNVTGGGQGEWSPGRVALIQLYGTVLTSDEVAIKARDPFAGLSTAPEPSTWSLASMGALGFAARLIRRRKTA